MGDLIDSHRDKIGFVDDDVCSLEDRIAQETVGLQILILDFLALFLIGGDPLKPGQRGDHGQEKVKLGVLGYP